MPASPQNSFSAPLLPPGRWEIDPDASTVGFRVRHFRFAIVDGRFTELAGTTDASGTAGSIDVASIDTGHPVRDERLRSPDFFDAGRFPQMTFEAAGPIERVVNGQLTIRDVTRPLVFEVEPATASTEARRLRARTSISRKAFGLDWAGLREAGRLIVSDRVDLLLELVVRPASAGLIYWAERPRKPKRPPLYGPGTCTGNPATCCSDPRCKTKKKQ